MRLSVISRKLGWACASLFILANVNKVEGISSHPGALNARSHALHPRQHFQSIRRTIFDQVQHTNDSHHQHSTDYPLFNKCYNSKNHTDGTRDHYYKFIIQPRWLAPDGFWRLTYTINGKTPGPLIDINEGDTVHIHVFNADSSQTTLHFHGIEVPPTNDGVPGVTQWNILPFGEYSYKWTAHQSGAFWYHSHARGTYADGVRGSIVIHPRAHVKRPWKLISKNGHEQDSMEKAYQNAGVLQLHDWRHETIDSALVRYRFTGQDPYCVDSILINSQGRIQCPSVEFLTSQAQAGLDGLGNSKVDPTGCIPPQAGFADRMSDVNPRLCTPTTSAYGVYSSSKHGSEDGKWAAFHLINTASEHEICFSIDAHTLFVVAADGPFVHPQEVQVADLSIGMRYTVLVRLDQPQGQYTMRASLCRSREQIASGYAVFNVDKGTKESIQSRSIQNNSEKHQKLYEQQRQHPRASFQDAASEELSPRHRSHFVKKHQHARIERSHPDPAMTFRPYALRDDSSQNLHSESPPKWSNGWTEADGAVTNTLPQDVPDKMWLGYNGLLLNGARAQSEPDLAPFPADSPPSGKADYTYRITIDSDNEVSWALNKRPFNSLNYQNTPLLFSGKKAHDDPAPTVLHAHEGAIIDVIFEDLGHGHFTQPAHPMHKHQNPVWVLGFQFDKKFTWPDVLTAAKDNSSHLNLNNPPRRDSWNVPVGGYAVTRHKVVKPGATLMHCHLASHLSAGMAIVWLEGPLAGDHVPSWAINYPHAPPKAHRPMLDGSIGLGEL